MLQLKLKFLNFEVSFIHLCFGQLAAFGSELLRRKHHSLLLALLRFGGHVGLLLLVVWIVIDPLLVLKRVILKLSNVREHESLFRVLQHVVDAHAVDLFHSLVVHLIPLVQGIIIFHLDHCLRHVSFTFISN